MKYIYTVWVALVFVVIIVATSPIVIIISFLPSIIRDKYMNKFVRFLSFLTMYLSGFYTKIYNKEKIDFSAGKVIVANHSSYLDPMLLYMSIPSIFKSLGKAEIGKVPFFKYIYKSVVVMIDRSSQANRVKSFLQMNEEMKKGISIVVFPEGTFLDDSQILLPFHEGAFKLAIINKKPIVPVLFFNVRKRFETSGKYYISPGKVECVFMPEIDTSNFEDAKVLKDFMYNYMLSTLEFGYNKKFENIWDYCLNYLKNNK